MAQNEQVHVRWSRRWTRVLQEEFRRLHLTDPPGFGNLHPHFDDPGYKEELYLTLFQPHGISRGKFYRNYKNTLVRFQNDLIRSGSHVVDDEEYVLVP